MHPTQTLIVDDSLMIVKIIKKALLLNTLEGHFFDEKSIYTASDGMEAFEKMGEHKGIKFIITDVNMPNLSGSEFIEILKDTGKLDKVKVIFVTSSPTKIVLPSSISDDILGIIYKPFRYDSFNEEIQRLEDSKNKEIEEFKRIKLAQFDQKKDVEKVCLKYLEEFNIAKDTDTLSQLIDENFGDFDVTRNEYPDITYAILSTYMFEINVSHNIDNKKILCILKSFEKKEIINKNRFGLISGFELQVNYVNEREMKLRKVLEELTVPVVDKINLALAKASKFPRYKPDLYAPYVDFIYEELMKIDCYFEDVELKKVILEQQEIIEFNHWLHDLLQKHKLEEMVQAVKDSKELKMEIYRRLKLLYKRSIILAQHFSGQIEFMLWNKAKRSLEILQHLKKKMPKTVPNSQRYLLYVGKIDFRQLDHYKPYEKENVIVLSTDLNKLELFKHLDDEPFNKWSFFCYTKESLFHSFMKNGVPTKIIVDYDFKTLVVNNGLQFLKQIRKKYPVVENLIRFNKIFVISKGENMVDAHKASDDYNATILSAPLDVKEVSEALLYT